MIRILSDNEDVGAFLTKLRDTDDVGAIPPWLQTFIERPWLSNVIHRIFGLDLFTDPLPQFLRVHADSEMNSMGKNYFRLFPNALKYVCII